MSRTTKRLRPLRRRLQFITALLMMCRSVAVLAAADPQITIGAGVGWSTQAAGDSDRPYLGPGFGGTSAASVIFVDAALNSIISLGGEVSLAGDITGSQQQRAIGGNNALLTRHHDTVFSGLVKFRTPPSSRFQVGYERIKGLRERGQRRGGAYEVTKSKTFNVPVNALFHAWADNATRRRWLGVATVVCTATVPKSIRLQWPDGAIVAVGFTAKGASKSMVALAHTKLADRSASDKAKNYWTDRFDALASLFAASAG